MTNDNEEPSAASAGSLVEERVLFRLAGHLRTTVDALKRHVDSEEIRSAAMLGSAAKCRPIGAYVHTPTYDDLVAEIARLRLTDAERGAVEWCVEMAVLHATECEDEIAALRGFLKRTK